MSIRDFFQKHSITDLNILIATNKKFHIISICDIYNKTLDFMYAYIKWKFRTNAESNYANVFFFFKNM